MSTEKLTRKDIREPDSFMRVAGQYAARVVEHRKLFGGLVLGVLAIFLAIVLVSERAERRSSAASMALAKALEPARRGVEGSLDPNTDPDLPKFKSFKEKNEELAKQLEEVRAQYSGTEAATSATLFLGDAQFHLGKLEDAAKSYEAFLAAAPQGDPMRVLALEGLGYTQEARKDWEKALSSFDQMSAEAAGDATRSQAALHKARVLEESGKKQEAASAFSKVKADFKETAAARAATERLALLAAQGIVPAAQNDAQAKPADAQQAPPAEAQAK